MVKNYIHKISWPRQWGKRIHMGNERIDLFEAINLALRIRDKEAIENAYRELHFRALENIYATKRIHKHYSTDEQFSSRINFLVAAIKKFAQKRNYTKRKEKWEYIPSERVADEIPTLDQWWNVALARNETKEEYINGERVDGGDYTDLSELELFEKRIEAHSDEDHLMLEAIQDELKIRRQEKIEVIEFESELVDTENAKPNPPEKKDKQGKQN